MHFIHFMYMFMYMHMVRMTAGEALTNLMWCLITDIKDIKASANWMWAAKVEGEGARMWEVCYFSIFFRLLC